MRYPDWYLLLLVCIVSSAAANLSLFPQLSKTAAMEITTKEQRLADGVIKGCSDQRIEIVSPALTNEELKKLVECSADVVPQLRKELEAPDWRVKVVAAHTLGLLDTEAKSAIPGLNSLIEDDNPDVRFAAAQALGKIGSEAVVPALTQALQDPDENVRVSAVTALQQIGNLAKSAKPFLIRSLWDGNWYVRSRAAAIISRLGLEEEDIPDLLQPWRDEIDTGFGSLLPLMIAIMPSTKNPVEDTARFLIQATQNKNPQIRENAVLALANYTPPLYGRGFGAEIIDILLKSTQDSEPSVRQRAIEALTTAQLTKEQSVLIMQMRQDPSANVRLAVVNFYDRGYPRYSDNQDEIVSGGEYIPEPDVVDIEFENLLPLLGDPDERVREATINLLGRSENAVTRLIQIFQNDSLNIEIRRATFKSIGKSSEGREDVREDFIAILERGLQDTDLEIRLTAAFSLNSIRDRDYDVDSAIFVEELRSENSEIRLDTIKRLRAICPQEQQGCTGGEIVLPLLLNFLQDNDKQIKYAAALAIATINPEEKRAEQVLVELLKDDTQSRLHRQVSFMAYPSRNSFNPRLAVEYGTIDDRGGRYATAGDCNPLRTGLLPTNGDGVSALLQGLKNRLVG
jgi:HEAT repeat protein